MLFFMSQGILAGETFVYKGIIYQINSDNTTVSVDEIWRDTVITGAIVIPPTVVYNSKNYRVTKINGIALSGCTGITSITIPSSVTSIGTWAFYGCTRLSSIYWNVEDCGYLDGTEFEGCPIEKFIFGESVKTIPYDCCKGMSRLTSIVIPSGVTSIRGGAFEGCTGLSSINWNAENCPIGCDTFKDCPIEKFTFGESVKTIPSCCCLGMNRLTSIEIPSSVTSIGNSAFKGCTGLTSIEIPSSVTSIGDAAFSGCTGLSLINWNAENCPIGCDTFKDCQIEKFIFGESVKKIPEGCCKGMNRLTSIVIPSGVTSIEDYAFSGCTGLSSINWNAENCQSIGYDTFKDCPIEKFTFGESVKIIPNNCCRGMNRLISIEIPSSVTSIGDYAFWGCTGLTSIEIPSSVTSIGYEAFYGCTGLTSIVIDMENKVYDSRNNCNAIIETATNTLLLGCNNTVIPNGITSIDGSAFYGCTGLTSITIPSGVTSIGVEAFVGCTGLTSIEIPSGVTSIGVGAFYGCTGLTSITIPSGVVSIEELTFLGCSGLTSITIPNSVTSIDSKAFYGCTGLTSIEILSNDTSIGDGAFSGCTSLKSVTSMIEDPSDATKFFDENLDYKNCKLYVPCDVLDIYKVEAGWRKFKNKECIEAKHVDEPLDDVVITPSNTKVVVAWPVVDNAESYVIEIKTGGKTFCVVTFNNKGQLLSIEYYSASERMAEARDASAVYGYQFSIASLTPETEYSYTITALDASERTLSLKSGSFTTTREPVSVDEQSAEPEFKDKVYVQDKNIMVEGLSSDDYSIYNTTGKQVSNPVPASGVYVVKVGDEAVKVMVK